MDNTTKTCIIVDDNYLQIKLIKSYINLRNDLKCINSFVNPEKALEYSKQSHIDIAFLDVQMDNLNGIELGKNLANSTAIIFITSSPNYAFDAFKLDAIDYLLKPVELNNFNKAVDKAIIYLNAKMLEKSELITAQKKFITISVDRKNYQIDTNDIIYIESKHEYFLIHTKTKNYLSLGSLKSLTMQLPQEHFIQIHKSYIINIEYINSYNSTEVELTNNIELPIGRVFKENLNHKIKQH